eukprot:2245807-Prymnesium_polylepis.1
MGLANLVLLALLGSASALQLGAVQPRRPQLARLARPIMQEGGAPAPETPPEATAEGAPAEGYGTFYDDEKDTAPVKPALSDNMRQKLLNEQRGLGADTNSKNPFLAVFAGVGVFVLLGA